MWVALWAYRCHRQRFGPAANYPCCPVFPTNVVDTSRILAMTTTLNTAIMKLQDLRKGRERD